MADIKQLIDNIYTKRLGYKPASSIPHLNADGSTLIEVITNIKGNPVESGSVVHTARIVRLTDDEPYDGEFEGQKINYWRYVKR